MEDVTFTRYDTADYLETEDDIAAYLEAVMEEGGDNPAYIPCPRSRGPCAQHDRSSGRGWHEPGGAE